MLILHVFCNIVQCIICCLYPLPAPKEADGTLTKGMQRNRIFDRQLDVKKKELLFSCPLVRVLVKICMELLNIHVLLLVIIT